MRRSFTRRLALFASMCALALTLQVCTVSAAYARSMAFQVCGPGQSLSFYNSNGCTFNENGALLSVDNHWDVYHHEIQNGNLYLDVYVDSSVPSDVAQQAQNAMNDWTNSAAYVILHRVYSASAADIIIYGLDPGYNLNPNQGQAYPYSFGAETNCTGVGGQTRIGITSGQVPVYLNYHYWDSTHRANVNYCSISGWRMTIAHELGHAMGLNHNTYLPKQLMHGCSNTSCAWVFGPQSVDIRIFNLMYPLAIPPCNPIC
jgi:hypothetical protein